MGMLLDDNSMPTNLVVVALLVIILMMCLYANYPKKAEGYQSQKAYTTMDLPFAGTRSQLGAPEGFLGKPEPPVFYDIGDINMIRQDRVAEEKRVKAAAEAKAKEGMNPNRWRPQVEKFSDEKLMAGQASY